MYLVSILESRPNTMGRGPAQVGATAAKALGCTKPFLAARAKIVAAWPPPKTTKSSALNQVGSYVSLSKSNYLWWVVDLEV